MKIINKIIDKGGTQNREIKRRQSSKVLRPSAAQTVLALMMVDCLGVAWA